MLIGLFLLVCGCLLYVFIKPASGINTEEVTIASEVPSGKILQYAKFKRRTRLLLAKRFPSENTGISQSSLDREAKQNA
ncbi:hypothetical protein V7201_04070 [Bacillus sp. JJ1122]|uniref:hypothetical protein n=1 Tax=Bacillus sp. JJ1122 TaxID=3122951 RepID=UPI002FFDDD40